MLAAWVWKGLVCFEASLPLARLKKGGADAAPPHVQTQRSHNGFGTDSYALKSPRPICKHNARTTGVFLKASLKSGKTFYKSGGRASKEKREGGGGEQ